MPAAISTPSKAPDVTSVHPHYKKHLPLWEKIRDFIEGEATVKKAGEKYLPRPTADDSSGSRYKVYKERARFYNATGRTQSNMVGQCFAVEPVYTGPDALRVLLEDVDGAGVTATQQAKAALGYVVAYSRAGVLVDYPKTGGIVTKADEEENGVRAKLLVFPPWQITNWRTRMVGAKSRLSLVVIKEDYTKADDVFASELDTQYRVLKLTPDNIYTVEIWRESEGGWSIFETSVPAGGDGQPLSQIPFTFIGAEANDATVEKPLLIDIADLNGGHYCNSADYEELTFMVGQPTLYAAGLTDEWVETHFKGKIQIGSRSVLPLPEGGSAGLIQPEEATLPKQGMDQKEDQMRALGAKLIENREVQQTATEKGLNEANASSILAGACKNVSAAYKVAFTWSANYQNVPIPDTATTEDEANQLGFELNTEFAIARMSPEERTANRDDYNGGLITYEEARDNLKSGGVAWLDNEEAKDEIEERQEKEFQRAQEAFAAKEAGKEDDGATEE